jgi:guanylate kinase
MSDQKNRNIVLISAPSGAGKTTLIKELAKREPLHFSISHTTRLSREGEQDGIDYHFVTLEQFKKLEDEGEFLEVTLIHGHCYGTSWKNVTTAWPRQEWLIMDLDTKGFTAFKEKKLDIVSIFIMPPSLAVLEQRILHRQKNINTAELHERLGIAKEEIRKAFDYDYIILNHDIDKATDELSFILRCEKLKSKRRCDLIESFM